MPKHLVIVESPAKAKTINHYLGSGYIVKASVGHVRDLPPKQLGVDIDQAFKPTYHLSRGKKKVVDELRQAAKSADLVYLATDPDREGEAIAWHVMVAAGIAPERTRRIAFYQITKNAVQEALAQPRDLDTDLIDAQQARRVLDRLVGYQISPLLSKTMHKRLSAGRVQSVALRLVVDREREIMAFVPEEYWSLDVDLQRRIEGKETFRAHLLKIAGKDPNLNDKTQIDEILPILEKATYEVTRVKEGTRQQKPAAPFVTSTLQSTAASRLHFSPRQTMRLAQQLYEGVDLDGERVGLITYMRTDSTHVAPEAQLEARTLISERFGADYLPTKPPIYKTKAAIAQEAHEAIRPTSVMRTPEMMQKHLDGPQARLYELIWQRFLASQMKPAVYATLAVDVVAAKDFLFRATGRRLIFPGFLAVYVDDEDEEKDQWLPPLSEGEIVNLLGLLPEQHFTQPPPRYSEATLIKAMEENGVGRPSTYASIIGVIQDRDYVVKVESRLKPTALGMIVCDTLVETFPDIMSILYTAGMEEKLDQIASGNLGYVPMLSAFYTDFSKELELAGDRMIGAVDKATKADLPADLQGKMCPECGKPMQVRVSKAGRFLGCTGYPECRYVLDLTNPSNPEPPKEEFVEGEMCEICGGRMKKVIYGRATFLGCEHYPQCKNTRPILTERIKTLAQETACPTCGLVPLEAKKGRYGEYLRCPTCEVNYSLHKLGLTGGGKETTRAKPEIVDIACPECGKAPLEKKEGKYGTYYRCPACKKNHSEQKMAPLLKG